MPHPSLSRPSDDHAWPARLVALLRAVWGLVLLTRPRDFAARLGVDVSHWRLGRLVVRLLGGRHLGQAAVSAARPTPTVLALGAVVDGLHALSAVGYAVLDRRHRRAGLTDAALATGFGLVSAVTAYASARARRERGPGTPAAVRRSLPDVTTPGPTVPARDDDRLRPGDYGGPVPTGSALETGSDTSTHDTEDDQMSRTTDRSVERTPAHQRAGGSAAHEQGSDDPHTTVRPRLMWVGVLIALVAMIGIGWAMVERSQTWQIVAVVALAVGVLLAWRGGVLKDVQATQPMGNEVQAAVHGGRHEGIEAGTQLHDADAQAAAVRTTRRTGAALRARVAAPAPPVHPAATLVLLLLAVWLFVGTFGEPYYYTVLGVNAANRAFAAAIVVSLCALWMRHVGPSRVAAALCALVGVLLLLAGVLMPHNVTLVRANEIGTGCAVVLAAVLALFTRPRPRRR